MTEGTAPTLRPLGVGEIVERTIRLCLASPGLFVALAALPYVVLVVANAVLDSVFDDIALTARNPVVILAAQGVDLERSFTPEVLARFAEFYALVALASVFVLSVQATALVNAMAKRYLDRPTSLAGSLGSGLSAGARLVPAEIIALAALGATLVAIANVPLPYLLPAVVGGIGIFVLISYLIVSWMPLPAVVTLEGRGLIDGLRRTWRLARGARLRILGLLVMTSILQVVLGTFFDMIAGTVATMGQQAIVVQEVANIAANAIGAPIQWGAFTLLYYDLRVRKEAFGLELVAGSS